MESGIAEKELGKGSGEFPRELTIFMMYIYLPKFNKFGQLCTQYSTQYFGWDVMPLFRVSFSLENFPDL